MTFLILTETSAGYALFKAKDKKLLKKDDLAKEMSTPEGAASLLKLKQFAKFDSAAAALEEVSCIVENKVSPMLSSLLNSVKDEKKASLVVADPKLGNAINKLPGLSFQIISDSSTNDLYRAIREHLTALIPGLTPNDVSTMSLGLSHSLSRHKLKFSPDKVDTMIVQAIALLDDLDKELNIYAMRVKEWYGWHFPEMGKIINDNLAYAKVIKAMGLRTSAATTDLAEILPEEIETALKAAAEVSMGTEITIEDLNNITMLADQVISFTEYRQQLSSYLSARMTAIAPNLTVLVGELVGARLIAHAGSLMNLAKSPASTVQILGAEKALFRALKTKHDTPKYGLIYHASLIGQSSGKNKGKIARMLATKTALGLRVDALTEDKDESAALGLEMRAMIESRVRKLEGKPTISRDNANKTLIAGSRAAGKWEIKEAKKYNPDADTVMEDAPSAAQAVAEAAVKAINKDVAMGDDDESSEDEGAEKTKNGLVTVIPTPKDTKENEESDEDEDEDKEAKKKAEKKAKKEAKKSKSSSKKKRKSEAALGEPAASNKDHMSARSLHASVLILPNPQLSSPEHLAQIPRVKKNITFAIDIIANIRTLHTGSATQGDDISGLLYVPMVNETVSCHDLSAVPANVTHKDDLPNAIYDLIALAPWISRGCSAGFLKAAQPDASLVKAFIFYLDDRTATLPGANDPFWDGVPFNRFEFPIYAITGADGIPLLDKVAEYSGNMSEVWEVKNLTSYYDSKDFARVYMEVDTGQRNPLPGLWLFLLIVLGVLLGIVGLTSFSMHMLQYRHLQRLRRRVANGQVDLETLGIKRLSVPRRILEKFPIRIYVPEPTSPVPASVHSSPVSPRPIRPISNPLGTPPPVRYFAPPSPPLPPSPPPMRRRQSSQDRRNDHLTHDTTLQRGYSQSQCSICLDDFVPYSTAVRELPCLHVFHPDCIDPFLETQSSLCPLCKVSALPRGYIPPQLTNATVRRERNLRRMRARVDAGGGGLSWWARFRYRMSTSTYEEEERDLRNTARLAVARNHPPTEVSEYNRRSSRLPPDRSSESHVSDEESEENNRYGWRKAMRKLFPGFT
ncbi:Nop-domain-containing protein [Choiromyces venosus 120613-1]|uniref:Nucleolar protein 58 n=1 Tax=Choiromyces venosus 120613-1 TaxID=1336337 RepID=A0A3N4K4J3_9PEZI|nr:Nop-domain-containing protein [Choiromyces venosus 120613-1]